MDNKPTLVLGASENPERYSNRAIQSLRQRGHTVFAVGLREGKVGDVKIQIGNPRFENIDSITIYLSQKNQKQYYEYIMSLKPKRIIFNPGAENPELKELAKVNNIESTEACTLVLLATKQY